MLIAIWRCEGCGYWKPRTPGASTPRCRFCRTDDKGNHLTSVPNDEGRPPIMRHWPLWAAVRAKVVT